MLLEGKKVLITGGSRGLGRSYCEVFARHGADIAFTFSSDEKGAAETRAKIEALGRRGSVHRASVLDGAAMAEVVSKVEAAFGRIDVLVNNAGVSQVMPFPLIDEEDWDRVLDTNVKGTFIATRAVLKGMIRRKSGVILNVGSLAGVRQIAAPVHYATSKAAIKGFTESLSKEVARYQIRVNCVAPGLLEEGVARLIPDDRLKEYLDEVALHRTGTFEEVTDFSAFLVSDRNSYMTGTTIVMDGGL